MNLHINQLLSDIVFFAKKQKTMRGRIIFFLKGIIYFPFLQRNMQNKRIDAPAYLHEAGEHIYPLF